MVDMLKALHISGTDPDLNHKSSLYSILGSLLSSDTNRYGLSSFLPGSNLPDPSACAGDIMRKTPESARCNRTSGALDLTLTHTHKRPLAGRPQLSITTFRLTSQIRWSQNKKNESGPKTLASGRLAATPVDAMRCRHRWLFFSARP